MNKSYGSRVGAVSTIAKFALFLTTLAAADAMAQAQFQEVTNSSKILFSGESHGTSWGDVNGDSYPDLYSNNHHHKPSLWLNNKDGTFTNIGNTIDKWNADPNDDTHGGSFIDFDNDGDQDLHISAGTGNEAHFLVNENGVLSDKAAFWGLERTGWEGHLSTWFDVNNDGFLDFHQANNNGPDAILERVGNVWNWNNAKFGFDCFSQRIGQLADIDNDGDLDLSCSVFVMPTALYDYGTTPFTNITTIIPQYTSVTDSVWHDFDGDLRTDVFMTRSVFHQSGIAQHSSTKVEAQLTGGIKGMEFYSDGPITVDIDYRGQNVNQIKVGSTGWSPAENGIPHNTRLVLDPTNPLHQGIVTPFVGGDRGMFYIGYNTSTNRWKMVFATGSIWAVSHVRVQSTAPITGLFSTGIGGADLGSKSALLMNRPGQFVDETDIRGLGAMMSGIGIAAADFDNDMDVDLYLVQRLGATNEPNLFYDNQGDGTFVALPNAAGAAGVTGANFFSGAGSGDQATVADFDRDGFPDILVSNGLNLEPLRTGGPLQLFRNLGNGNNWIQLDLEGTTSNRDGVGAKIYATTPDGKKQVREQNGGYHRTAQNHQRVHFGLKDNASVAIEIFWPSGAIDSHTDIDPNKLYRATEGGGLVEILPTGTISSALAINDVSVSEDAGTAEFSVSLLPASNQTVSVDYATKDQSATQGADYVSASGSLTFNPGETNKMISVQIIDDEDSEGTEQFEVNLSNAVNASVADSTGEAVIADNEVSICDAPDIDFSADRALFIWKDCLTNTLYARASAAGGFAVYSGSASSSQAFAGVSGFSLEPTDLLTNSGDQKTIDFVLQLGPPWVDGFQAVLGAGADACIEVNLPAGAALFAGNRASVPNPFSLNSLGPCTEAQPQLSISDATVTEDAGLATFTVSLAPPTLDAVSVQYDTSDATATQGEDYQATSGTLVFAANEQSKSFTVPILEDSDTEGTESFDVTLSLNINADLADANGIGTIIDNEVSACGPPQYDPATERAFFLWKDCTSGLWTARLTAGGGYTRYNGQITASGPLSDVEGFSLEPSDSFDASNPASIGFVLQMAPPWEDGFQFSANGAQVCITVAATASAAVLVGPGRSPVTAMPFDPETLGPCSP